MIPKSLISVVLAGAIAIANATSAYAYSRQKLSSPTPAGRPAETVVDAHPWFVGINIQSISLVTANMSSRLLGRPIIVCLSERDALYLGSALFESRMMLSNFERKDVNLVIQRIFEEGICGYTYTASPDRGRRLYDAKITIGEYVARLYIYPVRAKETEIISHVEEGRVFMLRFISWPEQLKQKRV